MTDVYDLPRLRQMAEAVDDDADDDDAEERVFSQPVPTPRRMQWVQTIAGLPLFVFSGIRWLPFLLAASSLLRLSPGFEFLPDPSTDFGRAVHAWHDRLHALQHGTTPRQQLPGQFDDGRYFLRGNSQDPVCVRCEERRLKA